MHFYGHCEHEKARFFFEKVTNLTEEMSIHLRLHKIRTFELDISKVRHYGSSLLNLSRVHEATGNYNEAMVLVNKASVLRDVLSKFSSEREVNELSGLDFIKARIHFLKHDYRHALILYQSFVHGNLRSIPPLQKAAALHGIGKILFEQRRLESAMSYFRTALTIRERTHGESHYEVTETLYMMGRILHDQDEYVDALEVYNRAAKIQRIILGVEHISTLKTLSNIAQVSHILEEHFEALNVCTETIAAGQAALGQVHPFILGMLILRGTLLNEMGRTDSAVVTFERVARMADTLQQNPEDLLVDLKLFSCRGRNQVAPSA